MKFKRSNIYPSIAVISLVFFVIAILLFKDRLPGFNYIRKGFGFFNENKDGINNYRSEAQNIDDALAKSIDENMEDINIFSYNGYYNDVTAEQKNNIFDSENSINNDLHNIKIYDFVFIDIWFNLSDLYQALSRSESYNFGTIPVTDQEIHKIKNYLTNFDCENNTNLESLELERCEESKTLLNKINLNKSVEKILLMKKFYTIKSREFKYNISNLGTISTIEKTFKSNSAKKIIKKINEIKIIPSIDEGDILKDMLSNIKDPYTDKELSELIHLDFNGVYLSKNEIENFKVVLEDDSYMEERLFFDKFAFFRKNIFLLQLYNYLARCGLEIPDFMIDKYTNRFIKNPGQFDINTDEFFEFSTVQVCIKNRENHPITNKEINYNLCWAKREGEQTSEKCLDFIKKQNEFIMKTGPRFEAFFNLLREEDVYL